MQLPLSIAQHEHVATAAIPFLPSSKRIATFALLVLIGSASFLFSPKPKSICGNYIKVGRYMGVIVGCDAYDFINPAANPTFILRKDEPRQSRPLFLLLGTVLGYPLKWTVELLQIDKIIKVSFAKEALKENSLATYISFYTAFVIINFLTLLASLILFDYWRRKNAPHIDILMTLFLMSFLVFNFNVRLSFWTAHQQMMTLFVPLLNLVVLQYIYERELSFKKLATIAGLAGLGVLFYGLFAVLMPAFFAVLLWKEGGVSRRLISRLVGLSLIFFAPITLYSSYLKLFHSGYYSHELVAYRQIIWILDYMEKGVGAFLIQCVKNAAHYGKTLGFVGLFAVFAAGLVTIILRRRTLTVAARSILGIVTISLASQFFFLYSIGYYQPRLSLNMMVTLIAGIAVLLDRVIAGSDTEKKRITLFTGLFVCISLTYHLASQL